MNIIIEDIGENRPTHKPGKIRIGGFCPMADSACISLCIARSYCFSELVTFLAIYRLWDDEFGFGMWGNGLDTGLRVDGLIS